MEGILVLVVVDRIESSHNVTAVLHRMSEGEQPIFLPDLKYNGEIPPMPEGTGMTVVFNSEELHLDRDETWQLGNALGRTHPND